MPIIDKLISAYRMEGIDICTGLASHDFGNLPSAPFTRFVKDGRSMTGGLGIALQEIYLLENLFGAYRPRHVLIIGNSLGWSTLAIAMPLPDSQIAAMDAGFDENAPYGLDLTNRMAASAGLDKVRAVKGASSQDVAGVVDAELDGRVDFALIDGLHTNEQVVLDYEAIARKAARDAVYLFHNVYALNFTKGSHRLSTWPAARRKTCGQRHPVWRSFMSNALPLMKPHGLLLERHTGNGVERRPASPWRGASLSSCTGCGGH